MDWRFITRRSAMLAAVVGAGAALAAPAGALATTGSPVLASGSSFQATAQNTVWSAAGKWSAHSSLNPLPAFQYTSSSSGAGLSVFGNDDGTLKPSADTRAPSGVLDGFVGSDDAPTTGQLNNGRKAGGASEITVPVTQAPVAVLLSLPVGLTVDSGTSVDVLNTPLEEAVAGNLPAAGGYPANSWGAFLTANDVTIAGDTGNAGDTPIALEIRLGPSGTSFAFKNYLNQVATATGHPTGLLDDSAVWTSFLTSDQAWPAGTPVVRTANNGGGALVRATASTPGTLGYANLADAVGSNGRFTARAATSTIGSSGQQIVYAQLQNNGIATSGATFAEPSGNAASPTTAAGNCTTQSANVPGWRNAPSDVRATWNKVLASDPNVSADAGTGFYSACAVTYDVAWDNYASSNLAAGYTNAGLGVSPSGVFTSVKDYLAYTTSAAGQSDIQSAGYNRLPAEIDAKSQSAVAAIAFTPTNNGGGQQGGGTTTTTGSTPPPPPPPPVVVKHDTSATNLKPKLTVSASAITVALSCPKTKASCTGKVTLTAKTKVKKGKKTVTRTITIGTGKVTLKGGQSKKLVVKLNSAGKKALKSSKKLAVTVKVAATDTYGGKKTTTLHATVKQPAAKKKH